MKNNNKFKIVNVDVVVSAFNEEQNISNLIHSVLKQNENGYRLKNLVIFSDGSTDNTVRVIKKIYDHRIKIFSFKDRKGKSSRLNKYYKNSNSDILVQIDADVILSHKNVLTDIVRPIIKNKNVGMCGGNALPMKGKTFTEKAVNYTNQAYQPIKDNQKNKDNVYSVSGAIMAFRKELVSIINLPENVIAEDVYIYFLCLTNKFLYRYVPSAVVNYRSPSNLRDQIKQNTRFLMSETKMSMYFSKDLVERESYFPKKILVIQMLKIFIKHPFHCIYIFIVNRYCQLRAEKLVLEMKADWQIAGSTKKGFA